MRVCIVLLATLVACALSRELTPKEIQEGFAKWEAENIPSDVPQSSQLREGHLKAYTVSAKYVEKHNLEGSSWEAGINEFSGYTDAEKATHLGLNASTVLEERSRSLAKRSLLTVTNVEKRADDVNYSNKLPAIKNQGSCGSCWTFGATAALEYQVNRVRSNIINLSEQQYLDCVYEGSRDGCNGGWPTQCYEWTKNNGNMIAKTADYPYIASDGACRTNVASGIEGYTVSGSRYLEKGDANMLAAVQDETIGVISVAIGVINSFYSFKSGVYTASGCSSINHAVDVVGYGTLNGEPYFRVRNSWGANWGDAGHINMKRGPNTCALSSYGHYPLVSGGSDDGDDGDDGDNGDDDDEEKKTCRYVVKKEIKLKKVFKKNLTKEEAIKGCDARPKCAGISCRKDNCSMNDKKKGKTSTKHISWVKKCD